MMGGILIFWILLRVESLFFCDLGAHVKFENPTPLGVGLILFFLLTEGRMQKFHKPYCLFFGRKVRALVRRKREGENNAINWSAYIVPRMLNKWSLELSNLFRKCGWKS